MVPCTLCSTLASVWLRLTISSRTDLHSERKYRNTTTFISRHYLRYCSPLAIVMLRSIDLNLLKNVPPEHGRFPPDTPYITGLPFTEKVIRKKITTDWVLGLTLYRVNITNPLTCIHVPQGLYKMCSEVEICHYGHLLYQKSSTYK
jgi:hypothetical protein